MVSVLTTHLQRSLPTVRKRTSGGLETSSPAPAKALYSFCSRGHTSRRREFPLPLSLTFPVELSRARIEDGAAPVQKATPRKTKRQSWRPVLCLFLRIHSHGVCPRCFEWKSARVLFLETALQGKRLIQTTCVLRCPFAMRFLSWVAKLGRRQVDAFAQRIWRINEVPD